MFVNWGVDFGCSLLGRDETLLKMRDCSKMYGISCYLIERVPYNVNSLYAI